MPNLSDLKFASVSEAHIFATVSAGELAEMIEDEYGVPHETLNVLANRVSFAVTRIFDHRLAEGWASVLADVEVHAGDWLDW
jgi:hypothetical protein